MKLQPNLLLAVSLVLGPTLLLVASGCRTTTGVQPDVPKSPATPPSTSGQRVPDTMAAEASVQAVRHFNFLVKASGSDPVMQVKKTVEGRLAAMGYTMNPEAPDLVVQLAVSSSKFDQSGEYLRYEGVVEVGVNRTWDDKRLGFDTVAVRGKPGLGADTALRNMTADLSDATAAQVAKFARPEQSGLAVMDVTLDRPWSTRRDPEYSQRFLNTVKGLEGVLYCAMVAHDYEDRILTFRVAYLAEAMPEGLLNRLLTIRELKLKPRK